MSSENYSRQTEELIDANFEAMCDYIRRCLPVGYKLELSFMCNDFGINLIDDNGNGLDITDTGDYFDSGVLTSACKTASRIKDECE